MILCVGEILADCYGERKSGELSFTAKAGGAPFNLACAAKKIGGDVFFVGSVGNDTFGRLLENKAREILGDDFYIEKRTDACTTLAFVENDARGERSFGFYRKNTADYKLPIISDELIEKSEIVHIGSLMLSEPEGATYAHALAERAHKKGKRVSFDVNYRADIFSSEAEASSAFSAMLNKADIIKLSEDEVDIFGREQLKALSEKLVFITQGSAGSTLLHRGKTLTVPSISVKPVDTCGAGDAFYGACLSGLDRKKDMAETLRLANIVGALTTLKVGAIDALPSAEELATKGFGSLMDD